jgi:NitT/TauT family transport system substrate-binding protein
MLKVSRRGILALGTAAASASLAAPSVLAQSLAEITSIRSVPVAWTYAFEDFAIAMKYFEAEGVHVEPRPTGKAPNNDVLLSGAGTIMISPPDQVFRAQFQRQPIKMICGGVNKFASSIVVKKEVLQKRGITEASPVDQKIKSMRGMRLGTTGAGGAPDALYRYLLVDGGMDPERDCELVPLRGGGAAMLAALKQGQIDGLCLSSPTPEIAIQQFGADYLFNMCANPPPFFEDFLYLAVSVTDKTMNDKADLLVKYCRAIAKSLRTIATDPARFKQWAEGFFTGFPPGTFDASFPDNAKVFLKTPLCTEQQFERALQFIKRTATADAPLTVPPNFGFKDSFDTSLVTKAMGTL